MYPPNQLVIAHALAQRDMTGEELRKGADPNSKEASALYGCLYRMKRNGHVASSRPKGMCPERTFTLTDKGREELLASIQLYNELINRIR